jgi:hypothetical protein
MLRRIDATESFRRVIDRNTQGVKLIKLDAHDRVADVARVVSEEEDEEQKRVLKK